MLIEVEGSCNRFNLYGYHDVLVYARDVADTWRGRPLKGGRIMEFCPREFIIVRNGHMYEVAVDGKAPEDIEKTLAILARMPQRSRALGNATRVSVNESRGTLWVWLAGDCCSNMERWTEWQEVLSVPS